jgi:hypothetical protein
MIWTIVGPAEANHNPEVVVNGQTGRGPVTMDAIADVPGLLDAAGTRDPDGHALTYRWFVYDEAGAGIPGTPRVMPEPRPAAPPSQDGIPSAPAGGPPARPPRVDLANATEPRATITPRVAGVAHVILAVEDAGTPSLTSYRRVILRIAPRK